MDVPSSHHHHRMICYGSGYAKYARRYRLNRDQRYMDGGAGVDISQVQ